jgi:hypothetical protein
MVNNRPVTWGRAPFFSRTTLDPAQNTREEISYRVKWFHNESFHDIRTSLYGRRSRQSVSLLPCPRIHDSRNVYAIEIISGSQHRNPQCPVCTGNSGSKFYDASGLGGTTSQV